MMSLSFPPHNYLPHLPTKCTFTAAVMSTWQITASFDFKRMRFSYLRFSIFFLLILFHYCCIYILFATLTFLWFVDSPAPCLLSWECFFLDALQIPKKKRTTSSLSDVSISEGQTPVFSCVNQTRAESIRVECVSRCCIKSFAQGQFPRAGICLFSNSNFFTNTPLQTDAHLFLSRPF